jgi:hypothetical protein
VRKIKPFGGPGTAQIGREWAVGGWAHNERVPTITPAVAATAGLVSLLAPRLLNTIAPQHRNPMILIVFRFDYDEPRLDAVAVDVALAVEWNVVFYISECRESAGFDPGAV